PLASPVAGAFGGHSNGIFSNSRPPTSRAASMTSWYLPGVSPSSGLLALSNLIWWVPGARVGLGNPSTGSASSRPVRRHHCRTSLSHFVPSFFLWLTSYHTARLVILPPSACSTHIAT